MAMEDASGQQPAEQQSGLEKEERQSVQGSIAIKGTRNGLLLTLEPGTPFSDLLTALSERLSEAPGFFRAHPSPLIQRAARSKSASAPSLRRCLRITRCLSRRRSRR